MHDEEATLPSPLTLPRETRGPCEVHGVRDEVLQGDPRPTAFITQVRKHHCEVKHGGRMYKTNLQLGVCQNEKKSGGLQDHPLRRDRVPARALCVSVNLTS